MTNKTKTIQSSDVNWGDTVIIDGEPKTVGKYDVKSNFMGTSVCGYYCKQIEVMLFRKWHKGLVIGWVKQI